MFSWTAYKQSRAHRSASKRAVVVVCVGRTGVVIRSAAGRSWLPLGEVAGLVDELTQQLGDRQLRRVEQQQVREHRRLDAGVVIRHRRSRRNRLVRHWRAPSLVLGQHFRLEALRVDPECGFMGFQPTPLIVDQDLYLQAVKTLHELENGDRSFEMLTAVHVYAREPYLARRFESEMGDDDGLDWDLREQERRAIENYVSGIYLPGDGNRYFEGIAEDMETFEGPTADFIRCAAWSFLCAWTQRYGALRRELNVGGTLIEPVS